MSSLPKIFSLRRYPYEETVHHFIVCISDGSNAGSSEFYADTPSIIEFAERLINYPKNQKDEVFLEIGEKEDPRYAGYTGLRFYVRDAAGHTVLHVLLINRGDDLVSSHIEFSFAIEAAAINRLGGTLKVFALSDKEEIVVSLKEGMN